MIRDTIAGLGPKVVASRMLRQYVTQLYTPAAVSSHALNSSSGEQRRSRTGSAGSGGRGRLFRLNTSNRSPASRSRWDEDSCQRAGSARGAHPGRHPSAADHGRLER
jgi:hypothetical protein